jgi:serine/threonine protein kinase
MPPKNSPLFAHQPDGILRGAADEYTLLDFLDKGGAMGDSYTALSKRTNEKVFIKTPHVPLNEAWDQFLLKDRLARVFGSLFSEYANFSRLNELNCVARIKDAGFVPYMSPLLSYSVLLPFLVEEYVDGKDLRNHFSDNFNGLSNAKEWFDYAQAIVEVLDRVHQCQVVHGDIHPGNLMVRSGTHGNVDGTSGIVLIDFGQAFLADCSLGAPGARRRNQLNYYNAPESRAGQQWDHTADIYSLGGVLFYLATGANPTMPEGGVDRAGIIAEQIERKNPALIREAPSIPHIIAKATADKRSRRFGSVGDFKRDLRIFRPGIRADLVTDRPKDLKTTLRNLEKVAEIANPFLRMMAIDAIVEAQKKLQLLIQPRPRFEIHGDRETLISGLLPYLGVLGKGDAYWATTALIFWQRQNLGYNGRFMAMNEKMVRDGASIKRVFLLTEKERGEELWVHIVKAHERIFRHLLDSVGSPDAGGETAQTVQDLESRFSLRYSIVTEDEQRALLSVDHIVGMWVHEGTYTAISFGMGPDDQSVRKATFWSPDTATAEGKLEAMRIHYQAATRVPLSRSEETPKTDGPVSTATFKTNIDLFTKEGAKSSKH